MSEEPQSPPPPAASPDSAQEPATTAETGTPPRLGQPERDHLGRVLRSEYDRSAAKPAYLGDTPLPPEFEHRLLEIEKSEEIREKGVEALREALGVAPEAGADGTDPDGAAPPGGEP